MNYICNFAVINCLLSTPKRIKPKRLKEAIAAIVCLNLTRNVPFWIFPIFSNSNLIDRHDINNFFFLKQYFGLKNNNDQLWNRWFNMLYESDLFFLVNLQLALTNPIKLQILLRCYYTFENPSTAHYRLLILSVQSPIKRTHLKLWRSNLAIFWLLPNAGILASPNLFLIPWLL